MRPGRSVLFSAFLALFLAFASVTQAKTYTLEFPPLYAKQHQAIFDPHRYVLIEAGTKTGKTLGCAIWLSSKAWEEGKPGWIGWWVAPVYGQAEIGYRRCKSLFHAALVKCNDSKLTITLPNGALLYFKSAEKPDNLYGEGVQALVVDEVTRVKEASWWALRTTLTQTRGPVRLIGNPKGKKNWFYRWCVTARAGDDSEAVYYHLRSSENPHLDPREIEAAKKNLPPHVYAELYEGIAQDDETGVFRKVRACVGPCLSAPLAGHKYGAGTDLARLQDWTVTIVMDRESKKVVHKDRFNTIDWSLQKARIKTTLAKYNNAETLLDSTGVGDPVYDDLRKMGVKVRGYQFSGPSKEMLIENLAMGFEKQEFTIPEDESLLAEIDIFEYRLTRAGNVTYSAPPGYNDDQVIGLALAWWNLTHAPRPMTIGVQG